MKIGTKNEVNVKARGLFLSFPSQCSTSCGKGFVTRELSCKRLNSEGKFIPVPSKQLCYHAIQPTTKEACNEDVLCPGKMLMMMSNIAICNGLIVLCVHSCSATEVELDYSSTVYPSTTWHPIKSSQSISLIMEC